MKYDTTILHTPCGDLIVRVSQTAVIGCRWLTTPDTTISSPPSPPSNSLLQTTLCQLDEYFNRKRHTFTIPLHLEGTKFQMKVWQELLRIPYGQTISYSQLAQRVGNPKACRAVAGACHCNPIAVIVPCHRVVGKDGRLTGYASGLQIKSCLLENEKAPGLFRGLDYDYDK